MPSNDVHSEELLGDAMMVVKKLLKRSETQYVQAQQDAAKEIVALVANAVREYKDGVVSSVHEYCSTDEDADIDGVLRILDDRIQSLNEGK